TQRSNQNKREWTMLARHIHDYIDSIVHQVEILNGNELLTDIVTRSVQSIEDISAKMSEIACKQKNKRVFWASRRISEEIRDADRALEQAHRIMTANLTIQIQSHVVETREVVVAQGQNTGDSRANLGRYSQKEQWTQSLDNQKSWRTETGTSKTNGRISPSTSLEGHVRGIVVTGGNVKVDGSRVLAFGKNVANTVVDGPDSELYFRDSDIIAMAEPNRESAEAIRILLEATRGAISPSN
ncbi:5311_t:CDS:2, partial [Acaulospora colombiana]